MRRYKERPCPGCGKVEQRPPHWLCTTCRRQLKLGREREQEIAALKASGEKIKIAIGHSFAYTTGAFLSFLPTTSYNMLNALMRLARLEKAHGNLREARSIHFEYSYIFGSRPEQYVWAAPEQADDVELVLDYVQMVIERAYEDGQANGRSLILRLATAGVEDLNRITIG